MIRSLTNKILAAAFDLGLGALLVVGIAMIGMTASHSRKIDEQRAQIMALDSAFAAWHLESEATLDSMIRVVVANQDTIKTIVRDTVLPVLKQVIE
jgi:hypothetical protein